jgi:hypothetical protein
MKKIVLFLMAAIAPVFALSDVTCPYTFSDSGIIYASEHNANFDSLELHHNNLLDTLKRDFMRISYIENGDTTLNYAEIQVIKMLDTVCGNPETDSLKGNPTYHTGRFVTDTATINKNLSADSIYVTKGITSGQTVEATAFTGNLTGAVTGDVTGTADSAKGAHHLTGGAVSATTGVFSSAVTADSFYTAKGMKSLYYDVQKIDVDTIVTVKTTGDIFTKELQAWTPTFYLDTGTCPTYAFGTALYKQIGKIVMFWINLSNSSGGTAGTGVHPIRMAAPVKPYSSDYAGHYLGYGDYRNNTTYGTISVFESGEQGDSLLQFMKGSGASYLTGADQNNAARVLSVFGYYEIE